MPDFEREKYLQSIRAEAWEAFRQALVSGADVRQLFAHAAEVYERELRNPMALAGAEEFFRTINEARDILRKSLDRDLSWDQSLRKLLARAATELDAVLVREIDPTGQALKPLPFDERKRLLDTWTAGPSTSEGEKRARQMLETVQRLIKERGAEQPPAIIVMEDEAGPIFEKARQLRGKLLEVSSPEHDAFCMEETAKMAAEDVARDEGQ